LTVTFTNLATPTGAINGFEWAYGNGFTQTTSAVTHTYQYTQAGVYTISLTATGGGNSRTLTKTYYITLTGVITRDWHSITTTTVLSVAGEHAMAYDNDRGVVVLYGGNADGWPYEQTTWEFDGSDWQAITTSLSPTARYGAQMTYDGSQVILFGGSDETDTAFNQTWVYTNSDWNQVTISGTIPASRTYHSLAANPISGTVYLFGGNDGETYFNDLWQYENGAWTEVSVSGTVPVSRTLAALTYDSDQNRLLLFGGRSLTGTVLADLWAIDPAAPSPGWTLLDDGGGGGPPGRMAHSLTYDPATGSLVLIGGVIDEGDTLLGDTWYYQSDWTEASPSMALPARAYHQAVYTDNAIILFSDGEVWRYE
jgi:PKD repeat protein